jgi:hypothetical protein
MAIGGVKFPHTNFCGDLRIAGFSPIKLLHLESVLSENPGELGRASRMRFGNRLGTLPPSPLNKTNKWGEAGCTDIPPYKTPQ